MQFTIFVARQSDACKKTSRILITATVLYIGACSPPSAVLKENFFLWIQIWSREVVAFWWNLNLKLNYFSPFKFPTTYCCCDPNEYVSMSSFNLMSFQIPLPSKYESVSKWYTTIIITIFSSVKKKNNSKTPSNEILAAKIPTLNRPVRIR